VPLPVMIRYLCEYMAMDLSDEFPRLRMPTQVLMPDFGATMLADTTQSYLKPFFIDSWEKARGVNRAISLRIVPGSRIFVTDDAPGAVTEAIKVVIPHER
jgi:hypothetical protein